MEINFGTKFANFAGSVVQLKISVQKSFFTEVDKRESVRKYNGRVGESFLLSI